MIACPVRVIFGDTDQMGVVYHANFLRYFEGARGHFLRELGSSYKAFEAAGIGFPVVECYVKYRRPALYEDLLAIETRCTELRPAAIRFEYEVKHGDELLAHGYTRHACVGRDMKITGIPDWAQTLIPVEPPVGEKPST